MSCCPNLNFFNARSKVSSSNNSKPYLNKKISLGDASESKYKKPIKINGKNIINLDNNISYNMIERQLDGVDRKSQYQNNKKARGHSLTNNKTIKLEQKGMDINEMKKKVLKSQIGLYNAGGSCYMASIIQILIHLEKFVNEFLKVKYESQKPLSYLLFNFMKEIADSKVSAIEIKRFANEYNQINYKFNGDSGNNPMTFFNEFIKKLEEENNGKIVNLFTGKKNIKFIGMPELDYEEDFIFYLITLDEKTRYIMDALYQEREFEDDKNMKLIEEIKIKPEILVINLEIKLKEYDIEENLIIDETPYELKAINRYNNYHSTATISIDNQWHIFNDSQNRCANLKKIFPKFSTNYVYNLFYIKID